MIVELLRIGHVEYGPQFGVLKVDGHFCCLTLELPWKDNKKNESCIPLGEYVCKITKDRKTKSGKAINLTYEVENVPNRSGILFHVGNFLQDTHGCILLGKGVDTTMTERPMLTYSVSGYETFVKMTAQISEFKLIIKEI